MLQLAAAFGACADHCRHLGFLCRAFADRPLGFGQVVEPAVNEQQALGDCLLGRGEQTLVEPNGVGRGDLVETVGDLSSFEPAAKHL